jgi:hypothetical protein
LWAETAETSGGDLPDGTSEIFFARGLDTKFAKLPVGQISCDMRVVLLAVATLLAAAALYRGGTLD